MKAKIYFVLISLFLSSVVFAKPAKTKARAPAGESIFLTVNYGDRFSQFEIVQEGKGGKIILQQNERPPRTKSLTVSEVEYLKEKIEKLPSLTNDISLCPRSFVQLTAKKHNKIGCIGGQNAIAKELQGFANLLSSQF